MTPTAESLAAAVPVAFDEPPRATLACVQLPTDLTLDAEGPALLSRVPGVRLRMQKIPLDGESLDVRNYESARGRIARAAATLRPTDSIDVIGLACTSLAFALGCEHVQAELREAHPNAVVTDMASSMLAALDFLGVKRLALLTPYVGELHERNLELLRSSGLEVVSDHHLNLTTDEKISAVSRQTILELAKALDVESADALIIGCSAFRACTPGLLDELEQELGKPIVSSQQAFLWNLLRLAGIEDRIGGYGTLFSRAARRSEARHPSPAQPSRDSEDLYPSRVLTPGIVPRLDPVVAKTARTSGPLSAAQVDSFETRGVLVCRQVFTPPEVDSLLRTTVALRDHYESLTYEELDRSTDMRVITERGGSLVDEEDHPPTVKSIWQVHLPPEHAPHMLFAADIARRTVCDARLIEAARQLLGEDVYVHQSRINYQRGITKRSRGGSGFLWHQDFEQWHSEDGMPRMRAVSMAVLLEPARPTNGALMVMPGSHRHMVQALGDPLESECYAKGALSRGPEIPVDIVRSLADEHGIEHCRGEAGDVVLFDCNTMHGSHTNISPWGRAMFFAVYNAVSNTPAKQPFGSAKPRPEHIGSHDPRFAGVALPALQQSLSRPPEMVSARVAR
ncbi:MAG: ectoine hydroxylase [Planctomycetota bacterium]|jgi:ectoine hydroxylase